MRSTNRNAAAEARGVPETDQLGGTVNRENSLTTGPVQGQRGGRRSRAKGDRIEREIVSRHAAIGIKAERYPSRERSVRRRSRYSHGERCPMSDINNCADDLIASLLAETMNTQDTRTRLANRCLAETFVLECGGLRYTCTVGRFPDGRLAGVFLSNHKSNSAVDTNARDAAIVCSIALQCGADIETIRRALSRDSRGHATGPLGVALDLICGEGER
jgi:hypothetical protein